MVDAINLWVERYGNCSSCKDYTGRLMKKNEYNNVNSKYGWNIDHIRPKSDGGSSIKCNLEICTILTNEEKGSDFPHWVANGKNYIANRISKGCYEIRENN